MMVAFYWDEPLSCRTFGFLLKSLELMVTVHCALDGTVVPV